MKKIFITLLLLSFALVGISSNNNDIIKSANNFYKNKEYSKALSLYKQVLHSNFESSEIYYNIGNCYYKLDSVAYSIIYYEKAKLLSPDDDDILFNLKIANLKTVDKFDELPVFFLTEWSNNIINLFNSELWSYISIASFILFLMLLLFFFFAKNIHYKRLMFYFSLLLLVVSALTFSFANKQFKEISSHNYAIITTPTVNVKSSPDDSGTEVFIIHEGTKVKIQDKVGEWTEVKLSDGSVGWLLATDYVTI